MVAMGVGAGDGQHRSAVDGANERIEVGRLGRSRIDHGQPFAAAHEVALRTRISER